MYRIFYFFATLILPVIFGWWLFIPMAIVLVFLAKIPYEIIFVGMVFDSLYYFGEGFLRSYQLTIFSVTLILIALFLDRKISWQKRI